MLEIGQEGPFPNILICGQFKKKMIVCNLQLFCWERNIVYLYSFLNLIYKLNKIKHSFFHSFCSGVAFKVQKPLNFKVTRDKCFVHSNNCFQALHPHKVVLNCSLHGQYPASCDAKQALLYLEKQAAIEKPLFVDKGCLEMCSGTGLMGILHIHLMIHLLECHIGPLKMF